MGGRGQHRRRGVEKGGRKEKGEKKLLQALITLSLGILPEIEEYFIMFIGSILKKE